MSTLSDQSPQRMQEFMEVANRTGGSRIEKIPVTKARSMIGKLINRVHVEKQHIILEKSGMPVAALIDIDEFNEFLAIRQARKAGDLA